MKISLKWINEYVDIKEYLSQPKELAQILTAAGLEVESIEDQSKNFQHVVIGHILEKGVHPNADRLSLCQVATGEGRLHQIVCGAQNHKQGDYVVVALPGAVLPGDFAIKQSKIRGVDSSGMLCSEKELGLKNESEGILILDSNAPIGKSFSEYMGLDDVLLELKVTPNRADCLSHFGLAREIASLLNKPCELKIKSLHESGASTKKSIALNVQSELCPRYAGRCIYNIKVKDSPDWMKKRLESLGMKSINNIVDVTNYVMLELGQPLHAFDMSELHGAQINVSLAKPQEKFISLDGTEKTLTGDELCIRDQDRIVALAGVVGGQNSGIKDTTQNVFLEAAYFISSSVRKTSRALNIETDSSYRFGRGVNPEAVALAMNRAAQLIQEVAGGEIGSEAYDHYPNAVQKNKISITSSFVAEKLGYSVSNEQLESYLKRLGCQLQNGVGQELLVEPPLFRSDLTIEMDLVEEYARLHGYQHIPEKLPELREAPSADATPFKVEQRIRKYMTEFGYHQAVNYAFGSESWNQKILGDVQALSPFGLRSIAKPIRLVNPLNEELAFMRTSVIPSLMKNLSHNVHHSVSSGRLFELGFAHYEENQSYHQESRLGFVAWGAEDELWKRSSEVPQVFQLKSTVQNLMRKLQISRVQFVSQKQVSEFLHPQQSAGIQVEGKFVGFVGTIHPSLAESLKIRCDVALCELNLDKLMQGQPRQLKYSKISRQPMVDRDLSLVMPLDLAVSDVESVIKQTAGNLLKNIQVVDVFKGGNLKPDQRSVSIRLQFQDQEISLEDKQINELRDKIVQTLNQKYSIQLR